MTSVLNNKAEFLAKLYLGDCLQILKEVPDESVDLVLCDPPYGTTQCKWDSVIPFEPMWNELKRITKPDRAICLFGNEPFSSNLRMSNIKTFKYDWIWDKKKASNFPNAKKQPLKTTEFIHVFNTKTYYPQMTAGEMRTKGGYISNAEALNTGGTPKKVCDQYYPKNILEFSMASNKEVGLHPTQKPVALLEYLVSTYTIEGETVLDFTMGSGTTGVACKNLNRNFIGIEKDPGYFQLAEIRIASA